jgi:hypothetical protein
MAETFRPTPRQKTLPTDRLADVVDESLDNVKKALEVKRYVRSLFAGRSDVPQDVVIGITQCLDVNSPVTSSVGLADAYLRLNRTKLKSNRNNMRERRATIYLPMDQDTKDLITEMTDNPNDLSWIDLLPSELDRLESRLVAGRHNNGVALTPDERASITDQIAAHKNKEFF